MSDHWLGGAIQHIVEEETSDEAMQALTIPWVLHFVTLYDKARMQSEIEQLMLYQERQMTVSRTDVAVNSRGFIRSEVTQVVRKGHVSAHVLDWLRQSDLVVAGRVRKYFSDRPMVPPEIVRSLTEDVQLFCAVEVICLDLNSGLAEGGSTPDSECSVIDQLYPELRAFVTTRKAMWSKGVVVDDLLNAAPIWLGFGWPEGAVGY